VRFQKPAGVVERQHAAARGLHVEVGQLLHDLAEVLLGAGMVVIPRAGEAPESAAAIGFPAKPGEREPPIVRDGRRIRRIVVRRLRRGRSHNDKRHGQRARHPVTLTYGQRVENALAEIGEGAIGES
jgi:hypothetical protein